MAVVELPVEWASATGGRRRLAVAGESVGECLAELLADHRGLAGKAAWPFEVFVNRENVRLRQGMATPVAATDVVQVVPLRG